MAEEKKVLTVSFDEKEAKTLYRVQTTLIEYLNDRLLKLKETKDDPNASETNRRIKMNYYNAMRAILKKHTRKMEVASDEAGVDLK